MLRPSFLLTFDDSLPKTYHSADEGEYHENERADHDHGGRVEGGAQRPILVHGVHAGQVFAHLQAVQIAVTVAG